MGVGRRCLGVVRHGRLGVEMKFCVPSIFEQLFTISAIVGGHPLPLVHVLMTGRKEALYSEVLDKLLELSPSFSPSFWMGDFEASSRKSVQSRFPNSRVSGCHFHFSRAVFKKLQKLGLGPDFKSKPEVRHFAKQLMAVAFLPPTEIQTITDYLFTQVLALDLSNHSKQNLRKLKSYIQRFWLTTVSPEVLSVYDVPHHRWANKSQILSFRGGSTVHKASKKFVRY